MRNFLLIYLLPVLLSSACSATEELVSNAQGKLRSTEEYDAFFATLSDTLNMPALSVAIINDSRVVYHRALGVESLNNDELIDHQTYFEAASLSKPLFAYFVMSQVEKGKIELDRPLHEYLPYPDIAHDERYKTITARMVLSHTSGFPNWRQDSLNLLFSPGQQYSYSGEGYKYLAHVLAKVNNVDLAQLDEIFQEEITARIGAEMLYYRWNNDIASHKASGHIEEIPTNNEKDHKDNDFGAAGGLHTEAVNYSKFLISLFEQSVLSQAATAELLQEQVKLTADDINALLIGASAWSLGFGMIPTEYGTCYWHAGNNDDFQSWMHFYPDKKYGIVLFTNSDKIQNPEFFKRFFEYMDDGIVFDMSGL